MLTSPPPAHLEAPPPYTVKWPISITGRIDPYVRCDVRSARTGEVLYKYKNSVVGATYNPVWITNNRVVMTALEISDDTVIKFEVMDSTTLGGMLAFFFRAHGAGGGINKGFFFLYARGGGIDFTVFFFAALPLRCAVFLFFRGINLTVWNFFGCSENFLKN
jgi:hypothetical protein